MNRCLCGSSLLLSVMRPQRELQKIGSLRSWSDCLHSGTYRCSMSSHERAPTLDRRDGQSLDPDNNELIHFASERTVWKVVLMVLNWFISKHGPHGGLVGTALGKDSTNFTSNLAFCCGTEKNQWIRLEQYFCFLLKCFWFWVGTVWQLPQGNK